jgi:DNA end-binding protein Ku
MEQSGRAALGRFVLSTKEHLVLLRPTDGVLALETLYYPEDVRIRDQREIGERLEGVEVSKEELAMAEQLVDGLARPFDPEEYPNETRAALVEFLEAKAAGEEIAEPEEVSEPAPVVDLMAALKASLAAAGGDAPEAAGGDKAKGDDQLSIEQGRLRGVKGGGEGRKSSSSSSSKSKAKTPAKKPATQRRRKAS